MVQLLFQIVSDHCDHRYLCPLAPNSVQELGNRFGSVAIPNSIFMVHSSHLLSLSRLLHCLVHAVGLGSWPRALRRVRAVPAYVIVWEQRVMVTTFRLQS